MKGSTGETQGAVEMFRHTSESHIHYNFCRIHQTLRVTPAMEAGIAGHVWSIEEAVSLLDSEPARQAA